MQKTTDIIKVILNEEAADYMTTKYGREYIDRNKVTYNKKTKELTCSLWLFMYIFGKWFLTKDLQIVKNNEIEFL